MGRLALFVVSHLLLLAVAAGAQPLGNAHGFVSAGILGVGTAQPVIAGGVRAMWVPNRAAFRAGEAFAAQWDAANLGNHSAPSTPTASHCAPLPGATATSPRWRLSHAS